MARNLILDDEMLEIVERYLIFPEYIEVATNWWCENLRHPKFDVDEEDIEKIQAITGWDCGCIQDSFSEEIERSFRLALLWEIERGIDKYEQVELYSDYAPTRILDSVCRDVGFDNNFAFPRNTTMLVSECEIIIIQGENKEILWSAY